MNLTDADLAALVAFFSARLTEAAAAARQSGETRIAWLTYLGGDGQMLYTTVAHETADGAWIADGKELPEPDSVLVVHETASALRDIAADRRIIQMYDASPQYWDGIPDGVDPGEIKADNAARKTLEDVIRLRAARFSDHPDYQPGWAP